MKTFVKAACCSFILLAAANAFAGYDAHITRAKDWTESKSTPIALKEWKDFVKGDKEFRIVDADKAGGAAIWTDPKDKKEWYFSYHEGEISVKDPEGDVLNKMKSIAGKLKAKVIGDEGEEL